MQPENDKTRRGIIKTGLASLAAAFLGTHSSSAAELPVKVDYNKYKKQPGETKVVYLGGDQLHNGVGQKQAIRELMTKAGFRFMYTQDARFVTPELLSDTDLLMITRWGGPIEAWSPDPIEEKSPGNDGYMSPELEDCVVDNVENRGMGFMALHCTVWSPDYKKLLKLMGISPMMHGPVQTVHIHNINQNHPITKGIDEFDLAIDENFGVELVDPKAVTLYETTGLNDKRHDIAGWCIEQGKGRVVGLGAGHTYTSWRDKSYRKFYWRGAHWALKRDIPPFEG